jgi:hypothetical protein
MRTVSRVAFVSLVALAGCTSPAEPIDGGSVRDDAGDAASAPDAAVTHARAFGTPVAQGTTPTTLPEISGIVASRTHPGVFWVENDSGNPAEIYAVSATGTLLATISLTGATNRDWEDLALAPGAAGDDLYVTDFGDNAARDSLGAMGRASIVLYRLPEPDPGAGDQAIAPEAITLHYPTIPHDCEAVFVEPTTRDLWVISKENAAPGHVFVARAPLADGAMLEEMGTLDLSLATAADITRDGTEIVVRNYGTVRVYDVLPAGIPASLASTTFTTASTGSAAEAICFDADDTDLWTIAEGAGATLFRIPRL